MNVATNTETFAHLQASVLLNSRSPLRRVAGLRATHQLWRQRKREQLTNFDEGGRGRRGNNSPTVTKEEGETHQLWRRRKREQLTNSDEGWGRNSPTMMKEEEEAIHQLWWRRKREQLTKCDEGRRGSNSSTVMKEGATHQQWWKKREQLTNCDEGKGSNSPTVMK